MPLLPAAKKTIGSLNLQRQLGVLKLLNHVFDTDNAVKNTNKPSNGVVELSGLLGGESAFMLYP